MWRSCQEQLLVRVVRGLFVVHMLHHMIVLRWLWSGLRVSLNLVMKKASVQREIVVFPTDLALRRYQMEQALADGFCQTAGQDFGLLRSLRDAAVEPVQSVFGFEYFGA